MVIYKYIDNFQSFGGGDFQITNMDFQFNSTVIREYIISIISNVMRPVL